MGERERGEEEQIEVFSLSLYDPVGLLEFSLPLFFFFRNTLRYLSGTKSCKTFSA